MNDLERRLFVVHQGLISQWCVGSDGDLDCVTCNGLREVPFDAAHSAEGWRQWAEDEQVSSDARFDAIFLSDDPNAFVDLPSYFTAEGQGPSRWTVELLKKIASEPEFSEVAITLMQEGAECALPVSEGRSCPPLRLAVKASLSFNLPTGTGKPVSAADHDRDMRGAGKDERSKPASESAACADSYGDKKALALKVGDAVNAQIAVAAPARGCYYAKAVDLDDLIKIKMAALPKRIPFAEGGVVVLKVIAVENGCVTYAFASYTCVY